MTIVDSTGLAHGNPRLAAATIGVVLTLSLVDLGLTLGHMYTTGMYETNPLAVAMVRLSPWALVGFKLLTMALCTSALLAARKRPSGWIGGMVCVLVLATVMIQWGRAMAQGMPSRGAAIEVEGAQWVCLSESCR